ncbi:MAG: hypothetical protein RKR03_12475 [Candidatus Competibacter sp.]|nr:hypothetical protein [Candidatus Competibacter sp.]MDS4070391.1 hypothetical protein [Candidatus Competibacter sp.]
MHLKIRHIVLALLAVLAIAFMQPLVSFLGGLTLLLGVGALIFRDLPPAGQEAIERRVLGWLRRVRAGSTPETDPPAISHRRMPATPAESGTPVERARRARIKAAAPLAGSTSDSPWSSPANGKATGGGSPPPVA